MDKRHILIVDDDQNLLFSMEFILNASNYMVTTAQNSLEAIEKILESRNSEHPIDLLITDFQMPGMNGLVLLKELNSLNVELPKLAMTAFSNKELIMELKRQGCDALLEKPFNEEKLLNRVSQLLGSRNQELTN